MLLELTESASDADDRGISKEYVRPIFRPEILVSFREPPTPTNTPLDVKRVSKPLSANFEIDKRFSVILSQINTVSNGRVGLMSLPIPEVWTNSPEATWIGRVAEE